MAVTVAISFLLDHPDRADRLAARPAVRPAHRLLRQPALGSPARDRGAGSSSTALFAAFVTGLTMAVAAARGEGAVLLRRQRLSRPGLGGRLTCDPGAECVYPALSRPGSRPGARGGRRRPMSTRSPRSTGRSSSRRPGSIIVLTTVGGARRRRGLRSDPTEADDARRGMSRRAGRRRCRRSRWLAVVLSACGGRRLDGGRRATSARSRASGPRGSTCRDRPGPPARRATPTRCRRRPTRRPVERVAALRDAGLFADRDRRLGRRPGRRDRRRTCWRCGARTPGRRPVPRPRRRRAGRRPRPLDRPRGGRQRMATPIYAGTLDELEDISRRARSRRPTSSRRGRRTSGPVTVVVRPGRRAPRADVRRISRTGSTRASSSAINELHRRIAVGGSSCTSAFDQTALIMALTDAERHGARGPRLVLRVAASAADRTRT